MCDTVIETKEKKQGRGISVGERAIAVIGRMPRESLTENVTFE